MELKPLKERTDDLEEYRETIEAIGWDFDAFRKVCQYSTFVGPTPAQVSVFDFLELAHSRGERVKELEDGVVVQHEPGKSFACPKCSGFAVMRSENYCANCGSKVNWGNVA